MAGDLKVISADANGVVSFKLASPQQKVEGIDLLVQNVALELMRNPGRNINDPTDGAGFRQTIGQNITTSDQEFFADMQMRCTQAAANLIARQQNTVRPPDARLASLRLLDIVSNEQASQLSIVLEVISEANVTQRAVLPMP